MKIFSGYVREQKRYTKNELKHILDRLQLTGQIF